MWQGCMRSVQILILFCGTKPTSHPFLLFQKSLPFLPWLLQSELACHSVMWPLCQVPALEGPEIQRAQAELAIPAGGLRPWGRPSSRVF